MILKVFPTLTKRKDIMLFLVHVTYFPCNCKGKQVIRTSLYKIITIVGLMNMLFSDSVLKVTRYLCFKIRPLLHVSLNNYVEE